MRFKYFLSLVIILVLQLDLSAQDRYQEQMFDEIVMETYTYATKDGENLDLDIYYPDYDASTSRALFVYVHGGGFSAGTRDHKGVPEFCTKIAQHGYVVATLSYRLTRKGTKTGFGCDCPVNDKLNTFIMAVEDIQDATFFLIENREQFGIDPQKIILSGSSAGAEAVLNAAYQPPYCYGLDSGPVSYAGVIGMAGAIPDTTVIYEESAVPSLLFHGTDDKLVPYATAPHHYCEENKDGYLILHGSQTIYEKLKAFQKPSWLHTVCGGGHEISNVPMEKYFHEIIEFCDRYVIQEKGFWRHTVDAGDHNSKKFPTVLPCMQ